MSHLLWKYYWDNDVDKFRRLLAPAGPQSSDAISKSPNIGSAGGTLGGSPLGTSPRSAPKSRKVSVLTPGGTGRFRDAATSIGKNEINSRDHAGLTLLLRAASSPEPSAYAFVEALLGHPAIDIYVQDPESGWNALHRALYQGRISVARMLLDKEREYRTSHNVSTVTKVGMLIKTKDHEGNSPFDVYNSTIATRSLQNPQEAYDSASDSDSDESHSDGATQHGHSIISSVNGDELYVFGSNKNLTLGVGDEDDRQFPERIHLKRPDSLLRRLYESYCAEHDIAIDDEATDIEAIPALIRNSPLIIQDIIMSKLHSAVLTSDPVSNLYICGVGRGGRLGLGDENTQFKFVPVQGPLSGKKIQQVALGQNHTMAITSNGELWTWGLNTDSQLGYALPPPAKVDEDPMCLTPRQIFGSLKKENIVGIAASAIHSVAHTGTSLYCWGKNIGQLALMDADSRSLDIQATPRKVAASLLSAPIEAVSAIDKATTCLLSNHTVWVFTNYGYNLVKFPIPDVFANYGMASSFSNRYGPRRREIRYITSSGDTIATVSGAGDLYTMHINHKAELTQVATSTTNPVKIKGALTTPQCIWDSRKDGVASVSVGEHGSVIICTESGAVWKRIKRQKGKSAGLIGSRDAKKKDFKFERVPYITNCVAARSSTFGAFAAIRTSSKVMTEEIKIQGQSLWDDIGQLLCLSDFVASELSSDGQLQKSWDSAISRERVGSLPYELLRSSDVEHDLRQWLQTNAAEHAGADMELRTSAVPNLAIPVHTWILAGRSHVLRSTFCEYRCGLPVTISDIFSLEKIENTMVLNFLGIDIYTLLNIVVFLYQDSIIPIWRYTRHSPSEAFRFRNIRSELMKTATRLDMPKLEAAARLQTGVEKSLDVDLHQAINDPQYFDDGDMVLELDGEDIVAHTQLLCQRCPFFEAMFHGRSNGQWVAGRRDDLGLGEKLRVDLRHMDPETFRFVLQYLYADVGPEVFDNVTSATVDDFSELILDVMAAANELMLDRLSQICQSLIGKFVTSRNISNLLNEIGPCTVTNFKDTGLEYICLQLESMLENHLLDDLDEDLLEDLDEVVRDNQLARFPFVRSGRAEALLHEKYPDLTSDIKDERQIRIREMAFKALQKEDDRRMSSSLKARVGSLDGLAGTSPTADRSRRRSKQSRNEPFSPTLRPKDSQADLMFAMEDDDALAMAKSVSPSVGPVERRLDFDGGHGTKTPKSWQPADKMRPRESLRSPLGSPEVLGTPILGPSILGEANLDMTENTSSKVTGPWGSKLSTSKLDLRDIMSETTSKSALTAGLSAQRAKETSGSKSQAKMSQKERKKQMQIQAEALAADSENLASRMPWEKVPAGNRPAPWKAAAPAPRTSLVDAMTSESAAQDGVTARTKPLVALEAGPKSARTRTASPDTRFSGQGRAASSPSVPQSSSLQEHRKPLVPHSKSYITPVQKSEASVGASMADIIGQQKREQELVKEAVAKRSLQEIQQEQAFQEWWDQESRRTQDEEAKRQSGGGKTRDDKGGHRGKKGKGGKSRSSEATGNDHAEAGSSTPAARGGGSSSRNKGVRGRGRKA